jgi:predicted ATPase
VEKSKRLTVLVGTNGCGKTQILEAIWRYSGRNQHSLRSTDLIGFNGDQWKKMEKTRPRVFAMMMEQLKNMIFGLQEVFWSGGRPVLTFADQELETRGIQFEACNPGARTIFNVITACYHDEGEKVLIFDDLGNSLHPKITMGLVEIIKIAMTSNPELQVIASTHTPYLLDGLEGHQVLVVKSNAAQGILIAPLSSHGKWGKWNKTLRCGEFWSHVGEDWVGLDG